MFQEMKDAAYAGNVEYLKKIVAEKPPDYLVTLPDGDRNIFHFAVVAQKVEFLREAINILPRDVVKQLLLQPNLIREENMLGCAALYIDYELIKVVRELYESVSWSSQDEKPWLWLNSKKMTALHTILREVVKEIFKKQEKCAMEILLMDPEFVNCTVVDSYGHTPLYYALKNGFNRVAEKILMAPLPANSIYSDDLENYPSPFTFATNNCSENVVRLLFKKFGKWLDKIDERGFTILHIWAEHGKDEPCKILLDGDDDVADAKTKIFKEMIFLKENKMADTPLHLAARKKESKLGEILIRGYQQQLNLVKEINQDDVAAAECPPWKIKNIRGNTPLHSSLYAKHEELALYILSIDPTLCQVFNNKNESPFFLSVMFGCPRVLDEILKIDEPRFKMLRRNDGTTVLHYLSALPEKTCPMLLNKYWWILNLKDNEEKTALDYAKRNNVPWLINMLSDPSLIEKEDFDWINACKREEIDAVLTFVDHCQNLQILCRDASDTPLHHIKLPTINAYRSFLENSSIAELKNNIDIDGATPLHRALQRKDMNFAKALLLDDEVQRTIKDNNGKTPMNLLATLCKENEDWAKMCKLINVDPNLNTKFLQQGTNLDRMMKTPFQLLLHF
ncbi:uncharacterized protein LOC141656485 [Silene latifolia]|uniref:uncharacterized protein LOC141656485 n=1 Tax=Silene latifolia TaxID=37657 RepID=UPI003D76CEC6